jgi:hypothetical protein
MKIEELIADGWMRHEEEPQGVHDSLAGAVALVSDEVQLHAFSRLLTHVHAEHLNNRSVGVSVLDQLRVRFEYDARDAYRPVTTSIGILRYIDGDSTALDQLSSEERASALATSASALAWHERLGHALTSFQRARTEASQGLPAGSPALRALAAAGNNLAVMLERKPDRDERQTAAMVEIADAALEYWKQAGGWLEEERAHYRCARSRIQAGRLVEALDCAERCLHTCEQNSAPAYELFFAYAVGALACQATGGHEEFERWRSLAAGQYRALAVDERASCRDDLAELGLIDAAVAAG